MNSMLVTHKATERPAPRRCRLSTRAHGLPCLTLMSLYATIKDRRKSWGIQKPAERKNIDSMSSDLALLIQSDLTFVSGSKENIVLPSAVHRSPRFQPSFWDVPTKKPHDYSAGDQALLTSIASYIPGIVARHFRQTDEPLALPHKQSWHACILFADISGFTPLTESLASQGKRGIELLTEHLNNYFGKMIDLIVAHGGDVVKFAGDALMSIFPAIDGLYPFQFFCFYSLCGF